MIASRQDVRFGVRQLLKSPAFSLVSILTLALGIGANIAVFSVTNAVLLNPSGIPHPAGLVALRVRYANISDLDNINMSPTDFGDAQAGANVFSGAAVMQAANFNYSPGTGNSALLRGAQVSSGYFDTFGVRPLLGRVFTPEEDQPGAEHEAVLSYREWRKHFGGDPAILGRTLILNNQPYKVIGVMGPDFNWPNQVEVWAPMALPAGRYRDENYRYNEYLFAIARLRPGVSLQQATAYLNMKSEQHIASEFSTPQKDSAPKSYGRASGWGMFAEPLTEMTGGALRKPLSLLLIAVGVVLLIACANIAGLQMARASARQREFAVRIALGAGSGRLVMQALVESVILTACGVVLGLAVARFVAPLLVRGLPSILGSQIQARYGGLVLIFVTAVAAICSLLCGVVPAWQRTRSDWFEALQEGGRSEIGSPGRQRARSSLVVAQIALSLLLLAGAGLLVSSLRAVEQVETGFRPRGVLSAAFSLPQTAYGPANPSSDKDVAAKQGKAAQDASDVKVAAFYSALLDRLRGIPGVSSAALAITVPFDNNGGSSSFNIKGQPVPPNQPGPHGYADLVSPDYFATLGIPLVRGREFAAQDRKGTEQVAIIDTTLAHQYWPGKDPIGEHIGFDSNGPWYTIVGLVAHTRASSLESDTSKGTFYLNVAQVPQLSATMVVRSARSSASLAPEVASAVSAVDPGVAIYDVKTLEERVDESLLGRRFVVLLLTTFAGLALLLAALGLYGVISYSVRLRTRELGVRMALGAQRAQVLRLVLKQGLRLAIVGMVCGALAAVALGRIFASLLFQVGMLDGLPWISAIGLILAVVLLATYLPARRAASIEPMQALRTE